MKAYHPDISSFFAALCMVTSAAADQFGNFTYTDNGTTITITDYPETATGAVAIPATISGKPVTGIGYQAFYNCTEITSVSIPASVNAIADGAFTNCLKMATVNIPDGVTQIGYNTFAACYVLDGITFPPSVTAIGDSAFSACKGLTSITIPPTVTTMGHSVFYICYSLASVTLSPNVTAIGQYQFYSCYAMTRVTIPAGVAAIDHHAFTFCGLTEANFKGNAPLMGADVFTGNATGFHVNFYNDKTGFTTPAWNGYGAINVGNEPFPEIAVEQPPDTGLADGLANKNFGDVTVGKSSNLIFTIRNTGAAGLTGLAVTKTGTNAEDYQIGEIGATTVAPAGSTTFQISFTPSAAGTRTASIQIASDDADENPFDIQLTGTGTEVPLLPEITVSQPAGSSLVDGKAKKSFGTVVIGKTGNAKVFTVKNTGTAKLTGLAITKNGIAAKDFTVESPEKKSLAEGASTTFKVNFKPSAKGTRDATIQLKSNDLDENPFDIKLTGTGALR